MDQAVPPLPAGRQVALPGRGTTWIWDAAGPPGAPTVILLHGWMSTAALNWYPCFEPLSRHFRVVALDHHGHGRGIRRRRPFQLEDCADDVAELVRALEVGPAILVGYSMGGPIAQLTWRRHPETVGGLVLCATADCFAGRPELHDAVKVVGFGLSLAVNAMPPWVRQRGFTRFLADRNPLTPLSAWAATEHEASDPAALIQAGVALNGFDSSTWSDEIDVPTAMIVTAQDHVVSPDRQWTLARRIPGARIRTLDAGHRACVDEWPQFVPALIESCRSVAPVPGATTGTADRRP